MKYVAVGQYAFYKNAWGRVTQVADGVVYLSEWQGGNTTAPIDDLGVVRNSLPLRLRKPEVAEWISTRPDLLALDPEDKNHALLLATELKACGFFAKSTLMQDIRVADYHAEAVRIASETPSQPTDGRVLMMSLDVFERKCINRIVTTDDPDTREFARHALTLVREMADYRQKVAKERAEREDRDNRA